MSQNKALFLDRDGVINLERGYVHRREDFWFQEGIFELGRAAQARGYQLLVVTNQAGIARGYYTESEFIALTSWMTGEFARLGVHIARVYYCPYHPTDGLGAYRRDSNDRKPKPGMILRARADFGLDLSASLLIGDRESDMVAAAAAGVGTRILLRSATDGETPCHKASRVLPSLEAIRQMFFE